MTFLVGYCCQKKKFAPIYKVEAKKKASRKKNTKLSLPGSVSLSIVVTVYVYKCESGTSFLWVHNCIIHCKENPIYVFLFWELRGLTPNFYIHVSARFIFSQDRHISLQQNRQTMQSWKYINLSQLYECRNWETEHCKFVLEITVSFLWIHKWEPDIYIEFSPALHLQCRQ